MFQGTGSVLGGAPGKSSTANSRMGDARFLDLKNYRDPVFAILFLLQLLAVVLAAITYGPGSFGSDDDAVANRKATASDGTVNDIWRMLLELSQTAGGKIRILQFLSLSFGSSVLASLVCFALMQRYSSILVPVAFFATPVSSALAALVGTVFLIQNHQYRACLPLWGSVASVTLLTAASYYFLARQYVPFAAANLQTAMAALRAHPGLVYTSLATTVAVFGWTVLWLVATVGLYRRFPPGKVPCPDNPREQCTNPQPLYVLGSMLLSLFWTTQVLQNILQATVAGTIASWWSRPEGQKGSDLKNALIRSCTLSLGSISFGSLIVAAVQTLEKLVAMAAQARRKAKREEEEKRRRAGTRPEPTRNEDQQEKGMAEWLLGWLRSIAEYFNAWTFVYVGLYGYTYVKSGECVAQLFWQKGGFTTFLSDRLVYRVLGLVKFGLACMAAILTAASSLLLLSQPYSATAAKTAETSNGTWVLLLFAASLGLSFLWSSSILFVVESAVRSVMVCFVERGSDLQQYHPALHKTMEQGWSNTYPQAWATARNTTPTTTGRPKLE